VKFLAMNSYLVFTDLDGTLLDHDTYSYEDAAPALELLKKRSIPLVLCTSKTREETSELRNELGLTHPFITENGGGIFIPSDSPLPKNPMEKTGHGFRFVSLGQPRESILEVFRLLKRSFRLKGFSDMTAEEVAAMTGLSKAQAVRAMNRDFSEPFLYLDDEDKLDLLEKKAHERGLRLTRGGRFFHLIGQGADKGSAVELLIESFRLMRSHLISVALGDSLNDLPMLQKVDAPFLVQRPGGVYDPDVRFPGLRFVPGVGPKGWNRAILDFLRKQ